jgi:hypothetical protein
MNWGALKAIIKHYVLDDRQLRRTFLGGMGSMGMVMFVLVLAPILIYKKLPALFLFVVSSGSSVGAGLGMSLAMQKILCLRLRRLRSSRWRSAMGNFR